MTDHNNLTEMFVSSILKLHLLRKGYSVSEGARIDGRLHDLVYSKKNVQSEPVGVIDLKKYNVKILKNFSKNQANKIQCSAPIEHHTVFIKSGNEVLTDQKLASIIGSDDDLHVTVY